MIDSTLIDKFRDTINANGFAFFIYRNKNDKDLWNCICSAMDWISVSVNYLHRESNKKPKDMCSIEMYAYISSIDIIVEAIQQLHRVIFSTNEKVFSNDRECFENNIFGQTDLSYFKTIRSCFGAHPVRLDEPSEQWNKEKKRFACWSGCFAGMGSYSVLLYSNTPGERHILLDINIDQLNAFAMKNYTYLNVLIKEVERQYCEYVNEMKETKVICEGSPLARLRILREENQKRLDNDYYRSIIDELVTIFSTTIICKENYDMVECYRKALLPLIDELHENLQNMQLGDLAYDNLLNLSPKGLPDGWMYEYGKLIEYINGSNMLSDWENELNRIFAKYFSLSYANCNELYVLIQSALYMLECKNE